MMKLFFISILLFTNVFAYSQNNNSIIELKQRKSNIIDRIEKLQDSLKTVIYAIDNFHNVNANNDNTTVSIDAIARAQSYMISEPNTNGILLLTFDKDTKVNVKGYAENHFKACVENICGYIFRSSLRKTAEMLELIKIDEEKKRQEKAQKLSADFNKRLELKIQQEKHMLQKYGQSNFNRMKDGQFWIGMNEEMALFSLGKPLDVNRTVGSWGTHEQWVFNNNLFIYFENGKLTSFQN